MFKFILISFFFTFTLNYSFANQDFISWLNKFQNKAIKSGISENVVREIMANAKFLPKVIEYDVINLNFMKILLHIKKGHLVKK